VKLVQERGEEERDPGKNAGFGAVTSTTVCSRRFSSAHDLLPLLQHHSISFQSQRAPVNMKELEPLQILALMWVHKCCVQPYLLIWLPLYHPHPSGGGELVINYSYYCHTSKHFTAIARTGSGNNSSQ